MEWIVYTADPSSLYSQLGGSSETYMGTECIKHRSKLLRRLGRSFRELRAHPGKMGLGRRLQPGTYRSSSAPLSSGVRYGKDCQSWLVFVQLKGTWNLLQLGTDIDTFRWFSFGEIHQETNHWTQDVFCPHFTATLSLACFLLLNILRIFVYGDVLLQHFAFDLYNY